MRFERLIIEQIRDHILTETTIRELVRMVEEEMDGVAAEERAKLEHIEAELLVLQQRVDRLWKLVETTDLEVEEILPRLQHHQEWQANLEVAASVARSAAAERRELSNKLETVTANVKHMAAFLRASDITETKAFIRSFVKRVAVSPGKTVIHFTIPTPWDGPPHGVDITEVELPDHVRNTAGGGGLRGP